MKALSIHIPEPCHEDWQQMTPADQGRFCQSCAKQVVDFSMMTDQQVLSYISKAAGGICGRFADNQLQRPLVPVKPEKKKAWWVALAVPLLLLFDRSSAQTNDETKAASENIVKLKENVMWLGEVVTIRRSMDYAYFDNNYSYRSDEELDYNSKIKVKRTKGDPKFTVAGTVVALKDDRPLSFATVTVKGTKTATLTDSAGHFIIHGSTTDNHVVLTVNDIGFEDWEIFVNLKDTVKPKNNTHTITGAVVSESGEPIPFASITIKNHKGGVATDVAGQFTLSTTAPSGHISLVASCLGFENTEAFILLNDTNRVTIQCKSVVLGGLTTVVVRNLRHTRKPAKRDTIPAFVAKVFGAEKFTASPNPAMRGSNINIDVKKAGSYAIQLFDNNGTIVSVKNFEAPEGNTQTSISVPSAQVAGMYYIRLVDNKKKKQYTNKIVVL